MDGEIRIGTSGWNYPAGHGTWNGIFYPSRRPRGFDELRYYAERFDTVEVNSTFYRIADPVAVTRWIDRTPPGFLFSVKLYQKFTHPDMYLKRKGVTEWDLSSGDFDEFRRSMDPLAGAGRLAAILLQFPESFHADPGTREYLNWLLRALADYPLSVELRHRSWTDNAAETRAQLASHHASWTMIDRGTGVFSTDLAESGNAPFYVRLHGRNTAAWYHHEKSEDRYNYLYSPAELAPFSAVARTAAAKGRRVLMYMNNHFSAKAVANAAVLKKQLHQPLPGEYPVEMITRYPELTGVVATSGLPL